jgi:hypothetical protein
MKRAIVIIFAAMLFIAVPVVSFSQPPPGRGLQGKEITPENFNEVRSGMLQRIEERMKRLTQEKACVEAAKSADELKKCVPEGPRQKRMQ